MKKASDVLHGELTKTHSELIKNTPHLEEFIIDAMIIYAEQFKTPGVLYGEDAEKFIKQMQENETKKASPEEIKRINQSHEAMKKILGKSRL